MYIHIITITKPPQSPVGFALARQGHNRIK
jgi:hypothetical protein